MTQQEFNDIIIDYIDFLSEADWKSIAALNFEDAEELRATLRYYFECNLSKA